MVQTIESPNLRTRGAESLAVQAGEMIFTSGLTARMGRANPTFSSVEPEVEAVIEIAGEILGAYGVDLSATAKLKAYLASICTLDRYRTAISRVPQLAHAATSVIGTNLLDAENRLAIELVAGIGSTPETLPASAVAAAATRFGPLLFIGGVQSASDAGDLRSQAAGVLNAIAGALWAGGANIVDLVKVNNTAASWHNYRLYNEVYNERLRGVNAARCSVGGVLSDPLALIEVEAIAAIDGDLRFVDSTQSGVGRTDFVQRPDTVYLPSIGPCKGPHSHGARTGNLVFIAGECPFDAQDRLVGPGDIRIQTEQTMRNVQTSLEALDVSLADVVKANVTLSDPRLFLDFDAAYARYFEAPYPARTVVAAPLGQYRILVEIEAIAVVGARREAIALVGVSEATGVA